MKKFLLIVIIFAAGYFVYNKFFKTNPIEIKDNLIVSQASFLDINSASETQPSKFAFIEGEIKNTGEKALTNILITYTIGYDTLSAFINYLDAGNCIDFKTNSCRVRLRTPEYSLAKIKFEEKSN